VGKILRVALMVTVILILTAGIVSAAPLVDDIRHQYGPADSGASRAAIRTAGRIGPARTLLDCDCVRVPGVGRVPRGTPGSKSARQIS